MNVVLCVSLLCFTFLNSVQSALYGLRLNDLLQLNLLSWQPKLCPVFQGRDENDIKSFLGVDLSKQKHDGDQDWRPPDKELLGVGKGTDQSDDSKYDPDYFDKGSNKRPVQQLGSKVIGLAGGLGRKRKRQSDNVADSNRAKRGVPPESFDWRTHTNCASVHDIRYQQCGDCWAVASASVMSDRYCLVTKIDRIFSARQLVACAYPGEGGCEGGFPTDAMDLYKNKGMPTGGDPSIKTQPKGCVPYLSEMNNKLTCSTTCDSKSALDSSAKAKFYRQIKTKNVTEIMMEIVNYGPVVSVMEVYDDFSYYGGGVYKHVSGKSQGYHSVRILGYGVEKGVPYWLGANSWGKDWGEKGFFKIWRNQDHCHVESWITCGYPVEAYKS